MNVLCWPTSPTSMAPPRAAVHRLDFTRLTPSTQNDDEFCVNIIFIHGLRGHPRRTWEGVATPSNVGNDATKKSKSLPIRSFFQRRSAKSHVPELSQMQDSPSISAPSSPCRIFWPEEYLVPDIPQACVWTYGYNADVIGGLFKANNKNSISQHGQDLSVRLEREICNEKPLVFVVHSLGGIILKDAIRRSETTQERTRFIVFLGTPHRGSEYAGWGQIASNLARVAMQDSNKKILETLEVNNEVLDNIHEEFKQIASKGKFKVHSFQEARGVTGVSGLEGKVVDNFSSKLDLPREFETVESIDANHMQMARCISRDDQVYRAVSGVLKAYVKQELKNQQTPSISEGAALGLADAASSKALFMLPFSQDDFFIGREDEISEIKKRRKATPSHTRVALVGLGGVGKSQIAIEYAYRTHKETPHMMVIWIHASSSEKFQQGYKKIAKKLHLPGWDDPKTDVLQLVHEWLLDSQNGQWLMILDNVDETDIFFSSDQEGGSLASYLPQTTHGTILITSRNHIAATNLVGGHGGTIKVKPMSEEDAVALLHTKVSSTNSDPADAKALVHDLEYIPLAITHAAAYIQELGEEFTIGDYLNLFRESDTNQMHLLSKDEWKDIRRDPSIRHAVIATWQISFEHIRKTKRSAADLLALMSMYHKQGIPQKLVQGTTSELEFNDALAPLLGFSFVKVEVGQQAVTMHRLVQLSMRKWLEKEKEIDKWVEESTRAMHMVFPSGEYGTWEECRVLLPHLTETTSYATTDKDVLEMRETVLLRAARYYFLMGNNGIAEELCKSTLEIAENVYGRKHLETLTSLNNLAVVLKHQGKLEEAEEMHREALQGREKIFGREHLNTLDSFNNLAIVLECQGKLEEAEEMHREALQGYEKIFGREHLDTLTSLNNLAVVLDKRGKLEEAEEMHREALQGREKIFGREHLDTLTSLNNLAVVLDKRGKLEEAEEMHREALQGHEKILGREHPDVFSSLYSLAVCIHRQKRYSDALVLYQRAHDGFLRGFGAQHRDTKRCSYGLELAQRGVDLPPEF
ncbi:hypothetical protein J3E72DRAFT_384946 [Bipolaris maydis]|nr:hypothetical protein J3E72DRAFT_384946 [Bipolaris maydis]